MSFTLLDAVRGAAGFAVSVRSDSVVLDFSGVVTDTVVVTAQRPHDAAFPWPAAVMTVIPLQEHGGGADLAELLAAAAGLQIRRYGGLGAEAIPSIRGSTGSQVVVMVDGVPLGDAQTGAVALTLLPLERFARAEIYRGAAPAGAGGIGGAGAINLISRQLAEPGVDLQVSTGSFGDVGGRLARQWSAAGGRFSHLGIVYGRRIDNHFVFLDHNQTFHDATDDFTRKRENAQFAEHGGSWSGRYLARDLIFSARVSTFRRDGGRPGPLGYESPHAGLRHRRADAHLTAAGRRDRLRLDLFGSTTEQRLHDDLREVGFDPPGTVRSLSHDLGARVVLQGSAAGRGPPLLSWDGATRLQVGADWRRQWYRQWWSGEADPLRSRTTLSSFASLQLDLERPRLTLLPAWRWQRAADDFPPVIPPWSPLPEEPLNEPHVVHAVSPSLGLVWEARPGAFFVEGHAARTVRFPTWIELFGYRGGIDGNRELAPEKIVTVDAALRWRDPRGRMRVRLALFASRTEETVIFIQASQRTSRAENFGTTRTQGLEFEADWRLPGDGRSTLNLTWQRAVDRGDDPAYRDKELPFLPPLEGDLRLEQPLGSWSTGLTLSYKAANYRDRYNIDLDRAPARTVLGISLARTWRLSTHPAGKLATVTAEVVNLTDNDVYDVEGFPLPGRSYRLSLHLR
jgi:outer membrane cobalamin receptor